MARVSDGDGNSQFKVTDGGNRPLPGHGFFGSKDGDRKPHQNAMNRRDHS
jgi:hypothetical protein